MRAKAHLSATQISMWLRCPRQWAFRYIEHLRIPPSGAMKQSSVLHKSAEYNYRQKIASHLDLPLDEMTDFYDQTFRDEMQREEVVLDENQTPEGLKDQGIAAIKTHHKEIAPLVEPQFVEEKRTVALGGENFAYDLTGVLDVVDTADTVIDNKLLGKTPNQADLDKDIQLSTYSLLYRLWQRKAESKLRLDIVVKNKLPKAVQLETQRSREGLRMHLNTMGHIAKAIEAEAFPMNPTGWWCSPKFCGYWSRCMGKGMVTVDLGQTLEAKLEQSLSKEG